MNMRDYSYMDAYNFSLRTKQRFRAAIPKDKITDATRRAWDFEDQHAPMRLHYYQELERERLRQIEEEDALSEIKIKSEVRVKK